MLFKDKKEEDIEEDIEEDTDDSLDEVNKELNDKVKIEEESKEPTLADGIVVKEDQTKMQKFKGLFKLDIYSYAVLRLYMYWFIFSLFVHIVTMSTPSVPTSYPLVFLLVGLAIPFTSPYNLGVSWRAFYVSIPVILIGLTFNFFVVGPLSLVVTIANAILFTGMYTLFELVVAIFTKNTRVRLKNALAYFITGLLLVGVLVLITSM